MSAKWVAMTAALLLAVAAVVAVAVARPPRTPPELPPAATPTTAPAGLLPSAPLRCQADVRAVVLAARRASAADVPALLEAASTAADPTVAGNAIRALGRLGRFVNEPAPRSLLDDPRPRIRQEVVMALGASGDPTATDLLLHALARDDPATRALVVHALARLPGEAARAALLRIAADPAASAVERVFARAAR